MTQSKVITVIRWGITLIAVSIIIIHLIYPNKIDVITLILLSIAALPWVEPLFKTIELPGGVKIEFSDLEQTQQDAEKAGLLTPSLPNGNSSDKNYGFQSIAHEDPNLSLAGLRIEIERRLRELAKSRNIESPHYGISKLMSALAGKNVLTREEISVLQGLMPLLNKAAHGASVDVKVSKWAIEVGPRILKALENRMGEPTMSDLLARWHSRDGAAVAEVGSQLSEALVKMPVTFLEAMHNDPEALDSWSNLLQHHTFTIFQAKDTLQDKLYAAYYARLKELMVESLQSYKASSPYRTEAMKILNALSTIAVRTIH